MSDTSIEIVLKRLGGRLAPLEEGTMRYVIAENGVFLERRSGCFTTTTAVGTIHGGLDRHEEECLLHVPLLPAERVAEMIHFFRWAYAEHGGEAVLCLLYHPERRRFRWHCPEQSVEMWEGYSGTWYGGGDIEYSDPRTIPDGFVLFGDAHSHAHMPAYASATDQDDERFKDGLHIIVGRLDRTELEVHIDFVMDGARFTVEPDELLPGGEVSDEERFPEAWKERVRIDRRPYRASTWAPAARTAAKPIPSPGTRNGAGSSGAGSSGAGSSGAGSSGAGSPGVGPTPPRGGAS